MRRSRASVTSTLVEPSRMMCATMCMRSTFPMNRLLSFAVTLTLFGCGGGGAGTPNPFDPSSIAGSSPSEDPIQIDVQNNNFNDVTIWAIRSGQRIRLGRVTGKTDQRFRIPWNPAIPIYFSIDVVGGRGCTSNSLPVEPNARVWLMLPANIGLQPCQAGRR